MGMAGGKSDFSRHRLAHLELMIYKLAQSCNWDKSTGVSQTVGTDAWTFLGAWYAYEKLHRRKAAARYVISVTYSVTVTHTYSIVRQLYLTVYAIRIYKQNLKQGRVILVIYSLCQQTHRNIKIHLNLLYIYCDRGGFSNWPNFVHCCRWQPAYRGPSARRTQVYVQRAKRYEYVLTRKEVSPTRIVK
jgi:hypothetical protein